MSTPLHWFVPYQNLANAAFDEKTTHENLKVPLWLYYVLQVPFPENVATTFSEQYVGTVSQWFPGNAP